MEKYFYKIGDHVLLSSKPADVATPSRSGSDDFAYLQFGQDTPVLVVKDGDHYGG